MDAFLKSIVNRVRHIEQPHGVQPATIKVAEEFFAAFDGDEFEKDEICCAVGCLLEEIQRLRDELLSRGKVDSSPDDDFWR
jgi:hypothetical protein